MDKPINVEFTAAAPLPVRQPRTRRRVHGCVLAALIAAGVVVAIIVVLWLGLGPALRLAGYHSYRLDGISMAPTIGQENFFVVNEHAYATQPPQQGNIVAFHYPRDPERVFVNRIIGLPGERIEIRDGSVFVDGKRLQEDYVAEPAGYQGAWSVGTDEVFVLGDNRNHASDSHAWGPVPITAIVGRAECIYSPPVSNGTVVRPTYR